RHEKAVERGRGYAPASSMASDHLLRLPDPEPARIVQIEILDHDIADARRQGRDVSDVASANRSSIALKVLCAKTPQGEIPNLSIEPIYADSAGACEVLAVDEAAVSFKDEAVIVGCPVGPE